MVEENKIREMLDKAIDAVNDPKMHGMSYEDGVKEALMWAIGDISEPPLE